jgi:hypothetical protein
MPISIENDGDEQGNIHIAVEYDFFVSDIPHNRWASGSVKSRWTIGKEAGRYMILAEQETITNRKKGGSSRRYPVPGAPAAQ